METKIADLGSGLSGARSSLTPSDVFHLLNVYRKADPGRNNRANLLKAYWRHPRRSPDADGCLLSEPAVTNYGMLTMQVDRQRKSYLDTFRQRSTLFRITVDDGIGVGDEGSGDVHLANRNRRMWGEHISYAFEKYCIRRWDRLDMMINTTILNMLLFSRGPLWWRDATGMECRSVYAGDIHAPPESSQLPEEWDSFFVVTHLAVWELWDKMSVEGWNADAIEWLLKNLPPDKGTADDAERAVERSEDGTAIASAESRRTVRLAFFYQREKNGSVTLRVIPESALPVADGGKPTVGDAFLMERRNFAEDMAKCVSLVVDNPGLGKFHKTPSFAENIYVASLNYDNCVNKAADAVQINSMLILTGGDETTFRRQSKARLHDRIWLPPGMTPAQVRFTLPVSENMDFARSILQQTVNASGSVQIGGTNDAGAKTPKSATQSWFDGKIQEAINTADIVTFSLSLTPFGREAYRRFLQLTDADNTRLYEGKKLFERYLESKGVPKEVWQPENVEIVCRLGTQAATPASRLQNFMATIDLLARTPASKGEQLAIKEALISIHGAEAAEDYVDDSEVAVVDSQDRMIGHENEAMRDLGANVENFPVLHSDIHVRHLFGREVNGTAIGHLPDIFRVAEEIKGLMQVAPDPADEGLWIDKIAQGVNNMSVALQHSAVHVIRMKSDPSKAGFVKKAETLIGQLEKIMTAMARAFQKLQEQRQQRLAQERQQQAEAMQQGGGDAQAKAEEVELDRRRKEMELGQKLLTEQSKRDEMQKTKEVERQEKIKDSEVARQLKIQEAAIKAVTTSSAPKKPTEPRKPTRKE